MEQNEIIEGNRLIADFMGVKIGEDKYSWRPGVQEPLQEYHLAYHTSWNWLKPVVDKIYTYALAYPRQVEVFRRMSIVVDIVPCWSHCVEFIKFLNSQPVKP